MHTSTLPPRHTRDVELGSVGVGTDLSPSSEPRVPLEAPLHILVVDDDASIRDFVSDMLIRSGYRVTCAVDGLAGWNALCSEAFQLLITDHEMPRLTGLGLLRRIRSSKLRLPVILVSGRLPWDEANLSALLEPGFAMAKPFSLGDLLTKVRAMMAPRAGVEDDGGGRCEPASPRAAPTPAAP